MKIDNYLWLRYGAPDGALWETYYINHHEDRIIVHKRNVSFMYNVKQALPKAQANINSILGIP